MSTTTEFTRTLRLPRKHAEDWTERYDYGDDDSVEIVDKTARLIVLRVTKSALEDLIADALFYAEEMDPDNTGDFDYRPAARSCLAGLRRQRVEYTRKPGTFTIEVQS